MVPLRSVGLLSKGAQDVYSSGVILVFGTNIVFSSVARANDVSTLIKESGTRSSVSSYLFKRRKVYEKLVIRRQSHTAYKMSTLKFSLLLLAACILVADAQKPAKRPGG